MSRRPRLLAGLLALATASATLAALPPAAAAPAAAPGAGSTHQVTLITGDRVQARPGANGAWNLAIEAGREGAAIGFRQFPVTRNGRTDSYLVPSSAERPLAEGRLDRELFNITGLIRQGFDDARSKQLPLLVEYPEAAARGAAALAGVTVRRELPEVNLAAVEQQKERAAEFWHDLTRSGPASFAGGLRKIWLNGKVSAALDTSVGQVGAPVAWRGGHTGKGVTVAVLDTGIDDRHPDVAGKVKHSKDFSGKGNVKDGNGHGTHVAATAVGSGAAEGGKYQGVAPEADLAVGKVLNDYGQGSFADIIAGMTWAAAEVKAKMINLSLGGDPTDGTDPMSQAVNTLSRKHNTLFVAAAGNQGYPGWVASPSTADLALSVGSLTKSGVRSPFSGMGPRDGDGAVKPEISAPGSDIVAARASGTGLGEPVNDRYTKASGTSMATPHVAGGAAILAQQHPDWTAEQLKAALVATANPVPEHGVFEVGAGRLDVGRAATATVHANPSAHNVFLKWPGTATENRTVTYTNTGSTPVTLNLTLDLTGVPGSASPVKLSADTVTVPAGGQAGVTLGFTPRAAKAGNYTGTLTATGGGATLRTLIGANEEGEHYDVNARILRRDGKLATPEDQGRLSLNNLADGQYYPIPFSGTTRVPPGTYRMEGSVHTPRPGAEPSITTFANLELRIGKATTLNFDARQAKQVRISTDQPAARGGYWVSQMFSRDKKTGQMFGGGYGLSTRFSELYSWSPPGVSSPDFAYANNQRLEEPDVELFTKGPRRSELYAGWLRGATREAINLKLPSVHAGGGTVEELAKVDAKGKIVVLGFGAISYDEVYQRIRNVKAAGGVATVLYPTDEAPFRAGAKRDSDENPVVLPSIKVYGASVARVAEYAKTGGPMSLITRTASRYRYELAFPSPGKVPAKLDYPVKTADLAAVTMAYHGFRADDPAIVGSYVSAFGGRIGVNVHNQAISSGERVEHFTPGDWEINVSGVYHASGDLVAKVRLEGGKSYRQEWNKAVAGPGFTGTTSNELGENHPWAWATGNLIDVTVPWFTDAAGHPRVVQPAWGYDTGSMTLYGDGKELGRHHEPGRGVFLRGQAREYRLEAEVTRTAQWWRTSTKIQSAWTFRSPSSGALPLFTVRYAPPVNIHNLAPGSQDFVIPVTVPRQDGPAKATSLTVDYSVDDGATWQQAKVEPVPTGWSVTVRNPASGFVSLRARASDGEGNAVEQTVLKAYEIG
ncbi:S8 family serine peptidase [Crossiella sp. CA198]|uniref:S8 family serine peptidase n=1 Tax=Crossiella sp. CA198 TaxID=3455607 RepID=UPI003F8D1CEC